ncbi:MAG: hypothetical protein JJE52_01630 [Acidimicrobiia bacterium]|nr:hypothetical protein [Acidimicrobiia bacterium]
MMETMNQAAARLRSDGYTVDFNSTDVGHLKCGSCGDEHDPQEMTIDEVVRYEGDSNPDDESMMLALRSDCGRSGLYFSAFGSNASAADVAVFQRLP